MEKTGWETFFEGTLNLTVAEGLFEYLTAVRPLFFERPEDIKHPTNPELPEIRGGYYYYKATATVRGESQEVLVKRACNPHDDKCMELVAPVRLMECLKLDEGSEIKVTVTEIR